jgi:molybdopterin molybdotransferase
MHNVHSPGFSSLAPLSEVWAWLDSQCLALASELVIPAEASGRVLAKAVMADWMPQGELCAGENGYAVRAAECDGANAYNPLSLALLGLDIDVLPIASACPVVSGRSLPVGADAVLPADMAQLDSVGQLEVLAPVARGNGVERWRQAIRPGTTLLSPGHRLQPQDIGCLASLGIGSVAVLCQPRVAVVVPGAKSGPDALAPMLRALLTRDGARVEPIRLASSDLPGLEAALSDTRIASCQCVLLAGRGGTGLDDIASLAITASGGALALHGVALRPGHTTGMGTLLRKGGCREPAETVPIVLLPGEPFACLAAYDLLAARLVRRLAGADGALPYPVADFPLTRKIASVIGSAEIVPVRLAGSRAHPLGADGGPMGAMQSDGFVLVPEASEGYPAGAHVPVHLYRTARIAVTAD